MNVTGCRGLHIDDGVFKNLESLEELYTEVWYGEAIRFTHANLEELKMLLNKLSALEVEFIMERAQLENMDFSKLDKFKISIGRRLGIQYNDKWSFENTLKLVTHSSNDLLDCNTHELFKKTKKLHLQVEDMINLAETVSLHPSNRHSFCGLRDLEISYCDNLKYLFPMHAASCLRKLECLKISS